MGKFLAVFAILAALAGAIFAVDVSDCGTLSAPGTYKLVKDVRAQSGSGCFKITAQDVRLECGGHYVLGNDKIHTSGIYSSAPRTAISDCNITGFMVGVRLENSPNSLVNSTLVNVNYMPYVTEAGVYASSSPNATMRGSSIISVGPYSYGTYGVENVLDSVVNSPQYIAVASARNVIDSQVSGGTIGVMLNSGASARVAGSDVTGGQYGIDVSIGNVLIENNKKIETAYATQSEYAAAVRFFGAGEGNVMRSNTLLSMSGNADLVHAIASKPPVLYWNNFTDTDGAYVVAKSPAQLNASVGGQQEGNIYYNVMSGAVAVQGNVSSGYGSGLYIGMNGTGYPYGPATSQGRIVGNATDYAPLTPYLYVETGNLIVNASPANGGTVTGTAYNFIVPATKPINATANSGYVFTKWTVNGNCNVANPNAASTTVTVISGTCYATAIFNATGNLIVNASPSNGGVVSGTSYNFIVPATKPVNATANSGYVFTGWTVSGNCNVANQLAASTTVTVTSGTCYATAIFNATGNLIVNASPANGGTATGTSYNFIVPATKPVNATANSGYVFTGWTVSGNCNVANQLAASTTVTVTSGTCYATAIFNATGNLIVNASPANGGTATGTAYNFIVPAAKPINATANVNYTFLYWNSTGNCAIANPSAASTTVTVSSGTCYATAYFNYTPPAPQGCVCGVLSVPNYVCNVTQDLQSNGTCFNVQANKVTILCNGHSITGDPALSLYGIFSNRNQTTVKNCRLFGFPHGIVYESGTGGKVSGTYVRNEGGEGLLLDHTSGAQVQNSTFNSSGYAVRVYGGYLNTLSDLSVYSEMHGVFVESSNGNAIFRSNVTADVIGIGLDSSAGNVINYARAIAGAVALELMNASNNSISNSKLDSTSTSDTVTITFSAGNTLANNTLQHTGAALNTATLRADYSDNNYLYWNNFTDTQAYYIVDSGSNHYNKSISGRQEGNIYANVINGSVQIQGSQLSSYGSGLYIGTNGTGYPYSDLTSDGKVLGSAVDYAPLTPYLYNNSSVPPQGCVCGNLTTPNYVCNVTQDLTSTGTCFTVAAPNVTIQCNGRNITGSGAPFTYGVYSNNSWTRINGCRIAQFDTGVYSVNSNLTVQDSDISAMNTGINLYYAKNATIRNSIITGGSYCGIYADRSSGTIANNTVSGGSWAAIRLYTNVGYEYGPYLVYNNTLKPAGGSGTLMTIHGDINASIYWNNFTATSGYYIDESPATAKLNTTINGKPEGNIYANVISGAVQVQGNVTSGYGSGLYIGINGTGYPYSQATSQGKIIGNAVDYAPLTPYLYNNSSSPPPQGCVCGINLTTPNYVCNVTQDLTAGETCFTVNASNVTIQCNGHSITQYSGFYSIYTNKPGTRVLNCNINTTGGADQSIRFENGANNGFVNNTNISSGFIAIAIENSSGVAVSNTRAASSDYPTIWLKYAHNNTITGVSSTSGTADALEFVFDCRDNTISYSNFTGANGMAIRISLWAGVDNQNRFYGNRLSSTNGSNSLLIVSKDYAVVSYGNVFYWNNFTSQGMYINDTAGGNLYNTTINGKPEGNIYANVISGAVAVQGNVSSGYGSGLYIGMNGTGYPYSASTSQGKIFGSAVDYAPLTPYYFNNSSVPPQGCVCGINLTTPNYVCNVTQDLNAGVNNVCFNVLAYNVTIQCNGHSIIGRIYSNQNRTSVLGCNVSAYGHEILYNHTSNGLISGVTAIGISASDAIELSYSTNTTISNTNASSIYPGIRIEYGTGNSILNTRSTSSSYQGIIFVSSNGNQIVNSRAIAQGDQPGLWLYGDSSNNLVKDSVLSSNNGKALYLSGSSGTGASNNTIANNTLLSNSTLLALNYATNNLFYWNNFTQTNGYYIYDDSYAYGQYLNRFNATINGKPEGNIYANVLNGSVAIQGNVSSGYGQNLYIGMNGTGYPYKAATAQGKIYDPYNEVYDYAPLTPYYYGNNTTQQSCTCGNLTTPNYVCNVTQDLNSNGTCFTVYADNVTIQCNGHTITGDNQTGTYGVFSTRQSTTVKNCTISNYQNAILLESATNGLVLDNRLSTTHPTGYLGSGQWGKGYALWLTLSHGTVVRNNQVNATSSGIAIYSVNSNNSVIVGNNATASGHTGISVNGESIGASTGVAVENNTVYGNPAIELGSLSYSSVSGNNATGSGTGGGITMYGPDHCVIRGNRALSSGVGIQQGSAIQLYWANNNTLADNFANCSGGANGIDIAYSSSDNNVTNNTAASTSGTGLYIGYGSNANTGYCYRNSVDGNTVVSGGQAARLENAQIGTVSGNTFISAGGNSNLLYILGSGNTVYWNNFSATNGYYASIAGGNKLNTTINGKPEGNIYANVISGAVAVQGNVTSGYGAGLYIGMNGTGYPYSQATSQGKIVGNAVDYAPLTPFYAADSMPPPAPPSDDGNATARENVTRIEIPRPKQSPPEQVAEDEEPASKAAPKTTSKTEPVKTTPKGEPAPKTTPKADGKAAQKGEPESEPAATPKSVPKPASKAEPVPRITPKAEPAAKAEQKPAPAPAQKAEPTQAIAPKKAEPAAKGEAPAAAKREPAPQAATEAPAEAGAMASG